MASEAGPQPQEGAEGTRNSRAPCVRRCFAVTGLAHRRSCLGPGSRAAGRSGTRRCATAGRRWSREGWRRGSTPVHQSTGLKGALRHQLPVV